MGAQGADGTANAENMVHMTVVAIMGPPVPKAPDCACLCLNCS